MIDFDEYETPAAETRESIRVQRSEFIGVLFPVASQEEFDARLVSLQKEYFDATHHCWAWRRLETLEIRAHGSDAGEPSGTAGRPILQALESAALLDAGLVVVRYFGGVKLGTGGLSRAYRDSARAVIDAAATTRRILRSRIRVEFPYSALSTIYRLVSPPDVVLGGEEFGETNIFVLEVRNSKVGQIERELSEKRIEFRRLD
jgi:uncharacterized YigZ family protein